MEEKMRIGRRLIGLGIVIFALICLAGGYGIAANTTKSEGNLTSIEDRKIVIIDEKGYEVAPSAEIVDGEGKRTFLDRLSLPIKVYFEYESTKDGAVIKRIEEFPRNLPE
jgi:hypothetical protein